MGTQRGKTIEITSSDHPKLWYADKIGKRFVVHDQCSRDKNKWIVRTTIEEAGWPYGWVYKEHCKFVEGEHR